jgi:hypothetical protein
VSSAPQLVALDADVARLSTPSHGLDPAEDLLHPFAHPLPNQIAELLSGAVVDVAASVRDLLDDREIDPIPSVGASSASIPTSPAPTTDAWWPAATRPGRAPAPGSE